MFPIAVSFSAGVRVEVVEPEPTVAAEESEADELSLEADELSLEAAPVVVVVVAVVVVVDDDDELSPLLSLAVCEAVSQAARKKVAAKSAIRR